MTKGIDRLKQLLDILALPAIVWKTEEYVKLSA